LIPICSTILRSMSFGWHGHPWRGVDSQAGTCLAARDAFQSRGDGGSFVREALRPGDPGIFGCRHLDDTLADARGLTNQSID